MILTAALLSTALLTADVDPSTVGPVVEAGGVRVEVTVESQIYTWDVTNVSAAPIDRFELPIFKTYDYRVPPGWFWSVEDGVLIAEAQHADAMLEPNDTGAFVLRAGTGGPMLHVAPLTLGFSDETTRTMTVWGPAPRRPMTLVAVAGSMMLIALLWFGFGRLAAQRRG